MLIVMFMVQFLKISIPPPWKGFFPRPPFPLQIPIKLDTYKCFGLRDPHPKKFQSLLWGCLDIFRNYTLSSTSVQCQYYYNALSRQVNTKVQLSAEKKLHRLVMQLPNLYFLCQTCFTIKQSPFSDSVLYMDNGGKFLKKLWCCVGGSITR